MYTYIRLYRKRENERKTKRVSTFVFSAVGHLRRRLANLIESERTKFISLSLNVNFSRSSLVPRRISSIPIINWNRCEIVSSLRCTTRVCVITRRETESGAKRVSDRIVRTSSNRFSACSAQSFLSDRLSYVAADTDVISRERSFLARLSSSRRGTRYPATGTSR